MDQSVIIFLFLVAIGTYVQTVTGFALGLIVLGLATLLELLPIPVTAIIISIIALANNFLALHRRYHLVDLRISVATTLSMLPAVALGVWLLNILSADYVEPLKTTLGVVIMLGGLLLMMKPQPRTEKASSLSHIVTGLLAGILGGMFTTAGPPLVYHLYREPIPVEAIRSTLFAIFGIGTLVRIGVVTIDGSITAEILELTLYALPVVFLATLVGRRYPLPLSDIGMRRAAFGLLMLLGFTLLIS